MEVSCAHCHSILKVDVPADMKGPVIRYRCGKCGETSQLFIEKPKDESGNHPGWLVVHDENAKMQSYRLAPGRNMVGRGQVKNTPGFRIITRDSYMARLQFSVRSVRMPSGEWTCMISDEGALNKNVLNADRKCIIEPNNEYELKDGDVIQAARTKIVFVSSASAGSLEEAEQKVSQTEMVKTIII